MMMDCAPVKLQFRLNCRDGDIGQGSDGTQKSKVVVHSQYGLGDMVRPPGFEPGSQAWKAWIITPRQRSQSQKNKFLWLRFKHIAILNPHDRSVEGSHHACGPCHTGILRQVSGRVRSYRGPTLHRERLSARQSCRLHFKCPVGR